jgi:CHAT domain-containing protein
MTSHISPRRWFGKLVAVYLWYVVGGCFIFLLACPARNSPEQLKAAAEHHWRLAESLRDRQTESAGRVAVVEYERASQSWRLAGENRSAAAALLEVGDLYNQWGEAHEALRIYQTALVLAKSAGAALEEAAISNGMSAAHLLLGEQESAQTTYLHAMQLSRQSGFLREEARALLNQAEWAYAKGDRRKSLPDYQGAIAIFERLPEVKGAAMANLLLGHAHLDLGEPDKALKFFKRAQSLWEPIDDWRGRALVLIALGHLQVSLGNERQAKIHYLEAQPLIERVGDKAWQVPLLLGLSKIYTDMQRGEWAIPLIQKALASSQAMHHTKNEASISLTLGRHYLNAGKWNEALAQFDQAECLATELNDKTTLNAVMRERGRAYAVSGNLAQAQFFYQRAYDAHFQLGETWGVILALDYLGQAYLKQGNYQLAAHKFHEGVRLAKQIGKRLEEAELHYGLALVAEAQGHRSRAASLVARSIELAEQQRGNSDSSTLRSAYFAYAQNYFRLYVDLLFKQGKIQQAFEISEQSRARELNALLAQADVQLPTDAQTATRQKSRLDEIRQLQKQLHALTGDVRQRSAIENNIRRLQSEYDESESARVRTQAWQEPAQLHIKDIQQLLPPDTMLLEFTLGEAQSYLWEVTKTACRAYPLAPRQEIEKAVQVLLQSLRPGNYPHNKERKQAFEAAVRPLSQLLLAGVAPRLSQHALLIVADGVLQYLPFAVLHDTSAASADYQPLMVQHEISYLPSASTLALLRAKVARRHPDSAEIHVFADPLFSKQEGTFGGAPQNPQSQGRAGDDVLLPRLPETKREAEAVSALASETRVYLRERANVEAVKHLAARHYRAVHFATHATPDTQNPELSAIYFAVVNESGKPIEARLQLPEIYQLPWSAELVVLSACETALGQEIKGEGLVNLARGFMYAGSPRILASLWNVDDEATNELMQIFYRQYLKGGQTPRAALRAAQLALWQSPAWNGPWHWSAFTLQGEFH